MKRLLENAILSLLYVNFALNHLQLMQTTHRWGAIAPIVMQETLIAVLFLVRGPSVETSTRPIDWLAGGVGTFAPLLIRAQHAEWVQLGGACQAVGVMVSVLALASLGRSIGIVAARRGVQTHGAYRIVRHPMYAGHVVTLLGYLLAFFDIRNAVVVGVTLMAMAARIDAEERVLSRDPSYVEYCKHTRNRLVPGVI